jgi:sulfur-carrier protein
MKVEVMFWSYFRDLAGCAQATLEVPEGSRLGEFLPLVYERFPSLKKMERSTLVAVGVEYQTTDYLLKPGDQVSLFPPVQGG